MFSKNVHVLQDNQAVAKIPEYVCYVLIILAVIAML